MPDGVGISSRLNAPIDVVHRFARSKRKLRASLPAALEEIRPHGMIWASWPKQPSGVKTELTENVLRELALPLGLLDVKCCAIDPAWSGLKVVIRRALRG